MVRPTSKSEQQVPGTDTGTRSTPGSEASKANLRGVHDHAPSTSDVRPDNEDAMLERNVLGAVRSVAVDFAVQRGGRPDLSDVDVNIANAAGETRRTPETGDTVNRTVAPVDGPGLSQLLYSKTVAPAPALIGLVRAAQSNLVVTSVAVGVVLIGVTAAALSPLFVSLQSSHAPTETRWQPKVVRHVPPLPLANPSRSGLSTTDRSSN